MLNELNRVHNIHVEKQVYLEFWLGNLAIEHADCARFMSLKQNLIFCAYDHLQFTRIDKKYLLWIGLVLKITDHSFTKRFSTSDIFLLHHYWAVCQHDNTSQFWCGLSYTSLSIDGFFMHPECRWVVNQQCIRLIILGLFLNHLILWLHTLWERT